MSLITISVGDSDPQPVISGTICLPRIGTWHLDIKVDSDVDIAEDSPALVSINGGELDLYGTVTRAIEYQGVTQVRVVGGDARADDLGARGLQRLSKPKHYTKPTVGGVLADLLADSGNVLSGDSTTKAAVAVDIAGWTTVASPAGRQIAELLRPLGLSWRMLPAGSVWVGFEEWPASDIADDDFQTLEYDHWNGIITFGLLSPTLLPGTTIGGYRADRVEMTIEGDSVKARVWEPREDGARIDRDFAALGRGSSRPFDFYGLYPGEVKAQSDQAFDVQPDDSRLPAMGRLPIRHGLPGITVQVEPGAKVRVLVGWQGGDPRLPYCALWGGTEGFTQVQIGGPGLVAAQHGLVLAKCIDTFTGTPHFALGGTSKTVLAKE